MISSLQIVFWLRSTRLSKNISFLLILSLVSCSAEKSTQPAEFENQAETSSQYSGISPIPEFHNEPYELAKLGETLFHDKRLSGDESTSCASCHDLAAGGVDGMSISLGIDNKAGQLNAPTVFNASLNFRQFWDGRAKSLEAQAHGPIINPVEMGGDWSVILPKIKQDTYYSNAFNSLFREGVTPDNVVAAIASFERTLLTPNSRFDRYLKGESNAMSVKEIQGFTLFKELGCVSCHQGVNIGGNMYQHIGLMADYFADRGNVREVDFGLYNITKKETDRYKFKVPSLRNVGDTAPYFHDGSVVELDQAISVMAWYQLGITLEAQEISAIKAFLHSLSAPPIGVQNPAASKVGMLTGE